MSKGSEHFSKEYIQLAKKTHERMLNIISYKENNSKPPCDTTSHLKDGYNQKDQQ